MIHHSHLHTAAVILGSYRGEQPFSLFIREFFRADKKYGSRDRRQISHLCYCYYRMGRLFGNLPIEERLLTGLFLCSTEMNPQLTTLKPDWSELIRAGTRDKILALGYDWKKTDQFPGFDSIGPGVDAEAFLASHFIQPDLFLRARPGKLELVKEQLGTASVPFTSLGDTLVLPNGSKVEELLSFDRDVVVQDLSSQAVGELIRPLKEKIGSVWDCCAASGGKSIMAIDLLGPVRLTVSDLRENILINLDGRFSRAGIASYQRSVADLSSAASVKQHRELNKGFDLLIADVPCSGSGTWGRAPEHLVFFRDERIADYHSLQRKIINNTLYHTKAGGYYLYVTCSVYKQENEEQAEYIAQQPGFELVEMRSINGYEHKADTMFAALFRRKS